MSTHLTGLVLGLLLALPVCALAAEAPEQAASAQAGIRNGREIYQRFREGLADPDCKDEASSRWQAHFAHAPQQLAARNGDVLPLFGYVVEAVVEADLPTEFALIPFVESGYKPGARSAQGPAGLWQMIAVTARNHKVPMRTGYDGRLSPVDSTAAAVRYLKTLHGMFAGDWRLAVMAYNAGEYRVLGALKRSGQTARNARPETLPGLSPITHAYVRKLHALSCLMEQADDRAEWLRELDRPVPLLQAVIVPNGVPDIATWAGRNGQNAAQLQRLNPAYVGGRLTRAPGKPARLLAVAVAEEHSDDAQNTGTVNASKAAPSPAAATMDETAPASNVANTQTAPPSAARRHTVARGDNASKIAARYGIRVADLLQRNDLQAGSVLRPGKVLRIDGEVGGEAPRAAGSP